MIAGSPPPRRPLAATYRLQVHRDFPLSAATGRVRYLARLGISHAYSSPLLRARAGSVHGYDVVDPSVLNPEAGTERELTEFASALHAEGMGLVLDIVPNHMAIGRENPYWNDVLTHGRASPFSGWFDIDWQLEPRALRGRIVVAALGEPLGGALAAGKLTLVIEQGAVRVAYGDHRWPLDPATLSDVLAYRLADLRDLLGVDHPALQELDEIIDELASLPPRWTGDPESAAERRLRADTAAGRLAALLGSSDAVGAHFERAAREYAAGEEGARRMRTLLSLQTYQLSYWREGLRRLNYRRFFDITELIGVRVGDPSVFAATHERVLEWTAAGVVDGLRIDHVDGLRDPAAYLRRLDAAVRARRPGEPFILVEKILSEGERLREAWPVAGTTGYDFLNEVESPFVSAGGRDALDLHFAALAGGRSERPDFAGIALHCKRTVLASALYPDVERVTRLLARIAPLAAAAAEEREEQPVDAAVPPMPRLRAAAVALAAALPVYRTYFAAGEGPHSDDIEVVDRAIRIAVERGMALPEELALLRRIMIDPAPRTRADEGGSADPWQEFIERFQQLSGPAAAKGIEDTALYRDVPLASLCDVGGTPDRPLTDAVERFHRANAHRASHWPRSMLALSTHDTKRSADIRARLNVLSEIPDQWIAATGRWRARHRRHAKAIDRRSAPDAVTEYLFYQTVLSLWPLADGDDERVQAYMLKAAREAKSRTSWLEVNEAFESALAGFIAAVLADAAFRSEMDDIAREVIPGGWWNALARVTLQIGSPGIPDVYQGDELWDLALVDPDNRRPVDYAAREAALDRIERSSGGGTAAGLEATARDLLANVRDGRIKLFVVHRALQSRRRHPDLFVGGAYRPVAADGPRAAHVIAFVRSSGEERALVVVPRQTRALAGGETPPVGECWQDTSLRIGESREWHCAFTGRQIRCDSDLPLRAALGTLPVGLFISPASAPSRAV